MFRRRSLLRKRVGTTSGQDVSAWSYPALGTRERTITPWTQSLWSDGTLDAKVYGTPTQDYEYASVSYAYGSWSYYSDNSLRQRNVTPYYQFSDYTQYGTVYTDTEYGSLSYNYSAWSYYSDNSYRQRTVTPVYTYSDIIQYGTASYPQEYGSLSYSYGTWTYYSNNSYRNRSETPVYTYSDDTKYGTAGTSSNEYGSVSYSAWSYSTSERSRVTYYTYDSGSTVKTGATVYEYATITYAEWDSSTYWNGACGSNYYYVDYKKVRDKYTFTDAVTYGDYYNGDSRSQRIDGSCGWTRAWTDWANTGQTCNASGTAGQYSCDGTYTVIYYQQVRYYQYPDGSGTTSTEYRAGAEYSRTQVDGQCGYSPTPQRTEYFYYGYDASGVADCFFSGLSGSFWRDDSSLFCYTTQTGSGQAADGYYMTVQGSGVEASEIVYIKNGYIQ